MGFCWPRAPRGQGLFTTLSGHSLPSEAVKMLALTFSRPSSGSRAWFPQPRTKFRPLTKLIRLLRPTLPYNIDQNSLFRWLQSTVRKGCHENSNLGGVRERGLRLRVPYGQHPRSRASLWIKHGVGRRHNSQVLFFRRHFGLALLLIIGLLSCGSARSTPLIFSTNEAAWLAAVSGFDIGTYPDSVIVSDTLANVIANGHGVVVVSTPPPIFPGFSPMVGANFTSVNITFSSGLTNPLAVSPCLSPPCGFTFAIDVQVNFPVPVYGFAATMANIGLEGGAQIFINSESATAPLPTFYDGFFGVVGSGPINSLEFRCNCLPDTDENVFLTLPNIVVATMDEPSTFASLLAGLVIFGLVAARHLAKVKERGRTEADDEKSGRQGGPNLLVV